jgi:GWxTD domain-containing protein
LKIPGISILCGLALLLTSGEPARAQYNSSDLTLYGGEIVFNNPAFDSLSLLEFPFTVNRDQFSFYRPDSTDTNYYARIFAQVNLLNTEGKVIDSAKTYFSAMVPRPEMAAVKGYRLFNKLSLPVKPGIYSARLTVIDAVSKREGSVFYDRIVVEPPVKDHLSIGGVTLAYNITYVGDEPTANAHMVRNGFRVLTNPLSVFGTEDSAVYLYAELYNLNYDPEDPGPYRLAYKILEDSNRVFIDYGFKEREKPGNSVVITEQFDIKGWAPGIYTIQLTALDPATGQADTALVPFRIFAPMSAPGLSVAYSDTVDPYDSLSLEDRVNLVTYLLSPTQKQTLDILNDTGKENFLDQYWKEHDENKATSIIENRLEMIRRYRFSNRYFTVNEGQDDGWKTDRGRIYMTYGPYDEIEDINSPVTGNPYIIWNYYAVKEGKVFVFEDREGYGDYRLVHSNVDGEVHSDDWEQRLKGGSTELY